MRRAARRELHLGAVVLNKVLPGPPRSTRRGAARRLLARRGTIGSEPSCGPGRRARPPGSARVLAEVADSFDNLRVVAKREAEQRVELAGSRRRCHVTVADLDEPVHDLGLPLGAALG